MSSKNDKKVVLNYHNTILYESDLELLEGPHWLNDTIIGFYLDYVENERYQSSNVCFVSPEVTQCLKLSPVSDLPVFLDPLNFRSKNFAILPLNDCENPDTPGGSHWSLLAYAASVERFYHIDSSVGANSQSAKSLTKKLAHYLNIVEEFDFKLVRSLQQTNSYDCGVFVLCNIDNVLEHTFHHATLDSLGTIKEQEVQRKRNEVLKLIFRLASKQNKNKTPKSTI